MSYHGTTTRARGAWVGTPLLRVEDEQFLTGNGRYTDDLTPPRTLHASFVRSPVAAGRLVDVDASAARELPGVVRVLTAADLTDVGSLRAELDREGFVPTDMPLLASEHVRYDGEPVALVLAASPHQAEDGAEAVRITIDAVTAVTSIEQALDAQSPRVHAVAAENVLLDTVLIDDPAIDAVFSTAALVLDERFVSARVNAAPMEGRACLAEVGGPDSRLTLHSSTQVPHLLRSTLAKVLGWSEASVRVVAPDVGGGFGQKCVIAPEEVLISVAAVLTRRPVKWTEDRRENLVSGFSGHEQRYHITTAFDASGRFLAIRATIDCDIGAYSCYPFSCAVEPLMAAGELPGTYKLPRYHARARGVATNKTPMAPYRGVSRPQIVLVMERLLDKAAQRLGLDRVEIRRRNLIAPEDFPYRGVNGIVYDEGSYLESLEIGSRLLDLPSWSAAQERARSEGRLIGVGLACFSERTGYGTGVFAGRGMSLVPGFDVAHVTMDPTGGVTLAVGTSSHGQGHRTSFAQVVADELGLEPSRIRVVEGDTDTTPYGWGTFASRSMVIGGGSSKRAATKLADSIRRTAGHLLEVDPDDLVLEQGRVAVRGAPERGMSLAEIGRITYHASHSLPAGATQELSESAGFDPQGTFSNALHGVVVGVDQETGEIEIQRYVVVEDCGVVVNPLIVEGQVRGGVAQGIAAALYEEVRYSDNGQCQSSTFMDYLVPTAAEIPDIEIVHLETPCEYTETGAKGMGEGGTIGAPAAIACAVADALSPLGIEVDRLPITPAWVRAAIRTSEQRG